MTFLYKVQLATKQSAHTWRSIQMSCFNLHYWLKESLWTPASRRSSLCPKTRRARTVVRSAVGGPVCEDGLPSSPPDCGSCRRKRQKKDTVRDSQTAGGPGRPGEEVALHEIRDLLEPSPATYPALDLFFPFLFCFSLTCLFFRLAQGLVGGGAGLRASG